MASSPITSWEIDGETVADLIFLGSKITADGDCSHEIMHPDSRPTETEIINTYYLKALSCRVVYYTAIDNS